MAHDIELAEKKKMIVKDKLAILGAIILAFVAITAIIGPWIVNTDPYETDLGIRLNPPDPDYLMGTDHLGRCIFTRVLFGARVSISISIAVLAVSLSVGVFIGVLAGYAGGFVDTIIMRIIDILLAFPGLILAMAIAGILGPSLINTMIAVVVVSWVGYARITRAMVLSAKEKDYVKMARICGTPHFLIIVRHIIPNIISPIIVLATLDVGSTILRIAGLSFLGLGAQPPTAEWGAMINDGRAFMQTAPWVMFFPGLAILSVVVGFNLLGDGLRDLYDPKDI
ncbi:nickel transporter permease [Proteinivorax tanatarense]|uniref:Nickel transporter permease n=1 Tax=Proteinivorax tanatarense TaxID=1260629 RepID=A0AAU7VN96_9FIRM